MSLQGTHNQHPLTESRGDAKPTCDLQLIHADLTLQVKAAPPFGVIGSTQAGHVHNTLLMDIHVAGCRDRKRKGGGGRRYREI